MRGERLREAVRRLRRVERRELRELRVWLETTRNLIRLSALLFVPLVLALVTGVSNAVPAFSFLLFPPLAAGAYTLFADPTGRHSSPVRFVAGLTLGAVCGLVAYRVGELFYATEPTTVGAGSAALAVFLTGLVTWLLDVEVPAAFSSALLVLVTDGVPGSRVLYVLSIAVSSAVVATVFVLWRRHVYAERARYLYQSTKGDDHVLVPMRGHEPGATAMLGARLAAAHDAGKVVLLDLVDEESVDASADASDGKRTAADGGRSSTAEGTQRAEDRAVARAATDLEGRAAAIRTQVGVPCEVVVASEGQNPASTVVRTAHDTNCDLIAAPYETSRGSLSPFVRDLLRGDVDVVVHRSCDGRTRWKHVMVPVRKAGDVAHEMLDFAGRLSGHTGRVALCHCIESEESRRHAETMLRDLVETTTAAVETRISRSDITTFLEANAPSYDLVIMGASQDRSAASRFVSRPTFERVRDLDCDVVIVDRNFRF
ncbi:HPP family protein [Halomarina oriensis]|uniref:HPP family protein n=1 Tax=Halomarina oriensis TaxID=671145 RepID=A0A6B0GJV0_9EURY|nr:HPP family protein [Halomarina oriensis]MWG35094.1 HPP family protein [Halomarina oriensis]